MDHLLGQSQRKEKCRENPIKKAEFLTECHFGKKERFSMPWKETPSLSGAISKNTREWKSTNPKF